MRATLQALLDDLDELLDPAGFQDHGPNGLQVPGAHDGVQRVATAVTASAAVIDRAVALDAQLVLVHHGLFWGGVDAGGIDAALHRRLAPLIRADVALAAYHLPLDAHPVVGNNALLAEALGVRDAGPFGVHRGRAIGVAGRLDGVPAAELRERVERVTAREALHLAFGPDPVDSIAIVSGGGAPFLGEAIAAGHDALVTGEPAERAFAQAREGGVHLLAAGHHATETFGVRALGDRLAERFGLGHVFLDEDNPI